MQCKRKITFSISFQLISLLQIYELLFLWLRRFTHKKFHKTQAAQTWTDASFGRKGKDKFFLWSDVCMVVNYLKPNILDEKRSNFLAMKQFSHFCVKPFWTHKIFKKSFLLINQDMTFSAVSDLKCFECFFSVESQSVKMASSVFAKWLQRSVSKGRGKKPKLVQCIILNEGRIKEWS